MRSYLSKEFARVLGPGQIVSSLEHCARCSSDLSITKTAAFNWLNMYK